MRRRRLIQTPYSLFPLDPHDWQRKTEAQFILQINLNVMEAKLLKLHAAKVMNVGGMAFHLLQRKLNFSFSEDILLVHSHDSRALLEFSGATTPTRPDAKPHIINRQRRRRDHVEHSHERVHPVELAPHVLAKHAALQIREDRLGRLHLNKTASEENDQNNPEDDSVNRKGRETAATHPIHEPGDDR
jgi:hypothetical protein